MFIWVWPRGVFGVVTAPKSHNRIPAETMRYIQNQNHRQPAQGRSPGVSASVDVVVGNQRRR
ncbi:unnamed protein product [Prunus armeniaca]|uniref:Uncharacterized protein n=1 Tax=Prunus armeniaca TaxID=36596 RepID=A0A6J5WLZ1_PRUAR|nr:unnamed protein product [Prunus armeniaca]CAB4299268.1 unnamed protein product [Prunus armeniaca]